MPHIANAIGHFDIAGPDGAALTRFYSGLFGWTADPKGPGYTLMQTPGPDGAIVESEVAALTIGIVVPDLDHALGLTTRYGGRIVMPATDNGRVRKAQVADPAGNVVTLIAA
jgi:predicted enzyme related to lactoylglutathione lyase